MRSWFLILTEPITIGMKLIRGVMETFVWAPL